MIRFTNPLTLIVATAWMLCGTDGVVTAADLGEPESLLHKAGEKEAPPKAGRIGTTRKLIACQLTAAAREEAMLITDAADKVEGYCRIAEVQTRIGNREGALSCFEAAKAAAMTSPESVKASACYQIALAQAKCGQMDAAMAMAAEISDDEDRTAVHREIALQYVRAGDMAAARATAAQINDDPTRESVQVEIALAQAKGGDLEGAQKMVGRLADELAKAAVWREIARYQIRSRDKAAARRSLEAAQAALSSINEKGAQEPGDIYDRLRQSAYESTQGSSKSRGLQLSAASRDIARIQIGLGDIAEAAATVGTISDDFTKASAYCDIAVAQDHAKDLAGARLSLERASATAAKIEDRQRKESAFCRIAGIQTQIGDVGIAKALAAQISDEPIKAATYRQIAVTQAVSGDVPKARATAGRIKDECVRAMSLCEIAVLQVGNKDLEGAGESLNAARSEVSRIGDPSAKASVCHAIVVVQLRLGDLSGAKATTAQIASTEAVRAAAYRDIVAAQADRGDLHGAKSFAEQIDVHEYRAQSYCRIALAQSLSGDTKGAIEYIAGLTDDPRQRCQWLAETAREIYQSE